MIFFYLMDLTKIICWNCRGMSNRDTVSLIFCKIKKFNLMFFYLVETRVDSSRIDHLCSKLKQGWSWSAMAADGFLSGIFIL